MPTIINIIFYIGIAAIVINIILFYNISRELTKFSKDSIIQSSLYKLCKNLYIANKNNIVSRNYIFVVKLLTIISFYSIIIFILAIIHVAIKSYFSNIKIFELLVIIYKIFPLNITIALLLLDMLFRITVSTLLYNKYKLQHQFGFLDTFIPCYKFYVRLFTYASESNYNNNRINKFFIISLVIKGFIIFFWIIFIIF